MRGLFSAPFLYDWTAGEILPAGNFRAYANSVSIKTTAKKTTATTV
jgi:hypothetical protein